MFIITLMLGRNLTTHAINMATFITNANDSVLPEDDPFALYTGGAFLPGPTPGADPNRRGVQVFGQTGSDGKLNIGFYLTEPNGKGAVRIQNNDPLKMVLADEGFLSNLSDLESAKNVFKTYIKNIAAALSRIDPEY